MVTVGNLRDIQRQVILHFEWEIKDFLQHSDRADICFESPKFSFCGASWVIWIYPNGETSHGSVGFMGVYIVPMSLATPIPVDYSLDLKTFDMEVNTNAKPTYRRIFKKANCGWGFTKFISKSELIRKNSELLPSGVLTVICMLKKSDSNDEAEPQRLLNINDPTDQHTFDKILEDTDTSDLSDEENDFYSSIFQKPKRIRGVAMDELTQSEEDSGSVDMDELTQREEDSGNATVDKFTQTEEETGIFKLQQHFKEILENENVSDVILKVEDREFKSHRCVLAARSPVFLAMMNQETKEKNSGVVNIQDVNPTTFADFLRYVYTGNREIIRQENVVKLYTTADKYQVNELKKSCLDYMLKNVSVDNFCDVLSLSLEHAEKDLTEACFQFYNENTIDVISTPMWLAFLKKNPVASHELQLKHLKSIIKNKNSI